MGVPEQLPASPPPARPGRLFDRVAEWDDLAAFATKADTGPRIGLVYGRRRQGKTFMLRQLTAATGGFYWQALEEESTPALQHFGSAIGAYAGFPTWSGVRFTDWGASFGALVEQARGRPIVIDEFPYLLRKSPELPSVIQRAYDDARFDGGRSFRLLLCGSSLSVMTQLLTGQKALRGRAQLDMPLRPFDFRESRGYWNIADPKVAILVHAVLGGSPGYRDLLDGAAPATDREFGDWLAGGILNPSHALFREAEYLLAEDPSLVDRSLYRSILGAIASGESTRRGVGRVLGRPDTALDHPLDQLERTHFILRDRDSLRQARPLLRVADPLLRFHFAVLRLDLARFEARDTTDAWNDALPRFRSQVLGPHFEAICRTWTERHASAETLGGRPKRVGFTIVNDAKERAQYEIDVVAEAAGDRVLGKPRLLAIGEAKSSESPRSLADLARLDRLRGLLADRANVGRTKLLLFGRGGFDADLGREAARRQDVQLVDLERLYEGS